jgi:hypothetical protein
VAETIMRKEGGDGIFGCSVNNYYMVNYWMYNQFTEARTSTMLLSVHYKNEKW